MASVYHVTRMLASALHAQPPPRLTCACSGRVRRSCATCTTRTASSRTLSAGTLARTSFGSTARRATRARLTRPSARACASTPAQLEHTHVRTHARTTPTHARATILFICSTTRPCIHLRKHSQNLPYTCTRACAYAHITSAFCTFLGPGVSYGSPLSSMPPVQPV
eukprot:6188436-Pleurochrysis_carterae.AAC.3